MSIKTAFDRIFLLLLHGGALSAASVTAEWPNSKFRPVQAIRIGYSDGLYWAEFNDRPQQWRGNRCNGGGYQQLAHGSGTQMMFGVDGRGRGKNGRIL